MVNDLSVGSAPMEGVQYRARKRGAVSKEHPRAMLKLKKPREQSSRCVYTFQIEDGKHVRQESVALHKLCSISSIIVVKLKTLHCMLEALQVSDEVTQSCKELGEVCHCVFAKRLSEKLRCSIVIQWQHCRSYELYGTHSNPMIALLACEQNTCTDAQRVRYCLIAKVKTGMMYTFDLNKTLIELNDTDLFRHENNHRPPPPPPPPTDIVKMESYVLSTVETQHITLDAEG